MAWTSLEDRLHELQLILAGPILRRVLANPSITDTEQVARYGEAG